jgi:hypothetical protein
MTEPPGTERPRPRRRWAVVAAGLFALVVAAAFAVRPSAEPETATAARCAGPAHRPPRAKPATRDGRIVDGKGEPLLLRGFNVIPVWSDKPGRSWEAEDYACIAAAGFNVVRFAFYWDDLEPERGRFDATHLATLDRAVARAKAAGLYVVLDPIHLFRDDSRVPEWARTGDAVRDVELNARGYLEMLARRYAGEPAVAAYDPVNEPPTDDQDRVLAMYATAAGWIRAIDQRTIVLAEPARGDSSLAGHDLGRLAAAGNVAVSPHDYYAGGAGDGYDENGRQAGVQTWNEVDGYPAPDPSALEEHLLVNLRAARAAGLPVWIGEFGINPQSANAERWIDEKVALFKRHGLGYAWWAYEAGDGLAALDGPRRFKPFVQRLL